MQASMQKAFISNKASIKPSARSSTVRVCAQQERKNLVSESAKLLSAGLLSAALLLGSPTTADAKVILVQPEVKNMVTGKEPAKSASSSGGAKATKAKAPPKAAMTSEGGDVKGIILPLTLVSLAGGAFAWKSVDPGLAEMMVEGSAKDSRSYAGYEPLLKDTPFFGGSGSIPSSVPGNNAKPKAGGKKGKK